MNALAPRRVAVKSAPVSRRRAALDWPASEEVDGFTWEADADGPAAADDRWHAEPSTEPDWDALAEESAALDRLCAGGLL